MITVMAIVAFIIIMNVMLAPFALFVVMPMMFLLMPIFIMVFPLVMGLLAPVGI